MTLGDDGKPFAPRAASSPKAVVEDEADDASRLDVCGGGAAAAFRCLSPIERFIRASKFAMPELDVHVLVFSP